MTSQNPSGARAELSGPPPGGLRLRLFKGISWNLVYAASNQGSTFAANLLVANLLGRVVFGQYGMAQNTLQLFAGIAQFALGYTSTKYVAEFRSSDKEKAGRIMGMCLRVSLLTGILGSLALLLSAQPLAARLFDAPSLAPSLMIMSSGVVFAVMNGCHVGILAGLEAYRTLGMATMLSAPVSILVCAGLTHGFGLRGAMCTLVVNSMLQWGLLRWLVRREAAAQGISILAGINPADRQVLLNFALPSAIHVLTTMPAVWVMNSILARQANGFSALALYNAANSFRIMVVFLPNVAAQVSSSLLNNQKGLGNHLQFRRIYWTNIGFVFVIALLGAATLAATGPWLLMSFGRSFREGYPILLILALSTVPEVLAMSAHSVIQSQERMWRSFFVLNVPRDALVVILALVLVPRWGAVGLALTYTVGCIATLLLTTLLIWEQGLIPKVSSHWNQISLDQADAGFENRMLEGRVDDPNTLR